MAEDKAKLMSLDHSNLLLLTEMFCYHMNTVKVVTIFCQISNGCWEMLEIFTSNLQAKKRYLRIVFIILYNVFNTTKKC